MISLFKGISTFVGYLMPDNLREEQLWYYLTHSWEDKGVYSFLEDICPKVNIIVRAEFELTYYKTVVQRFSNYTTRTPPISFQRIR